MAPPTPTSPDTSGYPGADDAFSGNSDYTAQAFLVAQIVARIAGATLVQVKAVTNAGGLAPVGFVDVQPMVNMMDGLGNATPHGVIHHLPYFRLQGGGDAVILDPKVGDIGIAVFADRDIASVKATKQTANPGSRRQNDMADGLYIGGVLNGTPTQLVQFTGAGIVITAPAAVTMQTPTVSTTGNLIAGTGATAVFSTGTGSTVTVADGIIINVS